MVLPVAVLAQVWLMLGWRHGAAMCSASRGLCQPCLLGALPAVLVLEGMTATQANVRSWHALEELLRRLSLVIPNAATVHTYVLALCAAKVIPTMHPPMVRAIQVGINMEWHPRGVAKPWISYALSHLQHKCFHDFAGAITDEPEHVRQSISITAIFTQMTQAAVADEDNIDVIGVWSEPGDD